VVTLAGIPDALENAVFEGIVKASELIDLDIQRGEHPRFGATDVVPFIPIRDVTMEDCVSMARRLGRRVGETLQIPVFLYEHAATRPERQNLAKIRTNKFQYEQLKEAIATDDKYKPDFGPRAVSNAGATIIGARAPLIAFNVYLNTSNVEIAKKIAIAVRESSGGFAFVKGAGFLVEGKAQVSMNLTNYEKTPVYRVFETVKREAQRYGVMIEFSELVGLIPEAALVETAQWYLQLDRFKPDQLLETRISISEQTPPPQPTPTISAQPTEKLTVPPATFIEEVAEGKPTPGGGSVSALAGALAAALTDMVARLTVNKKAYAEVHEQMYDISNAAADLRQRLLDCVVKDGEAFDALMVAYRLPKDDSQREKVIAERTWGAADIPMRVCNMGLETLQLAQQVASLGNANAATDAAVGAWMALSAIKGAALNVQVNLVNFKEGEDAQKAKRVRKEVKQIVQQAQELCNQIVLTVEERTGISG
jgi:glutamate formiminotransferase/formiminotetrahydrofolate cyclodeaminase